eukprot:72412-Rhodomonas_salina.1
MEEVSGEAGGGEKREQKTGREEGNGQGKGSSGTRGRTGGGTRTSMFNSRYSLGFFELALTHAHDAGVASPRALWWRSTTVTLQPCLASASAMATPTMPAPTTTALADDKVRESERGNSRVDSTHAKNTKNSK